MGYLDLIVSKIFNKTVSKQESHIYLCHANEVIDNSWDSWKEKHDKLSIEEEQATFILRMQKQGCEGKTYEEALSFLDMEFPSNRRRQNVKLKGN